MINWPLKNIFKIKLLYNQELLDDVPDYVRKTTSESLEIISVE